MDNININTFLGREAEAQRVKDILLEFEKNKHDLNVKRGIYVYGDPGTGKTTFIMNILKEMDYDIIKYDAGDIRNKSIIDTITKHNMSDKNIMSLFYKKVKKIVIVMDEIDGMNNGDKGGINALIKIIRPKKTKKQKLEEITLNPIICIGNYHIDKKIKELMKVCNTVELKTPSKIQMTNLVNTIIPISEEQVKNSIINFIQGDLRKLKTIYDIYKTKQSMINNDIIQNIFQMKSYNDDTRDITKKLINNQYSLNQHLNLMNETDRTIVGLLLHENIIDVLSKLDNNQSIPFYLNILDNICFADYIDRITFQKQIWQFNEMSSLIKTMKNNKLYHETYNNTSNNNNSNNNTSNNNNIIINKKKPKYNPTEVRFTKVLTKYSTEYNNFIFIQDLCQQLGMDKKDLFAFFINLRSKLLDDNELLLLFENYEISKLDINRIYRYIDKYICEDASDCDDVSIISEDE
jgi:DNA polymerase III delta prime subunit